MIEIQLLVQYRGERARTLASLKNDNTAGRDPQYLKELQRDLDILTIPAPDHTQAIWLSGRIVCYWNTRRNSDVHQAIRTGVQRSIGSHVVLEECSIGFMQLREDGEDVGFGIPSKSQYSYVKNKTPWLGLSSSERGRGRSTSPKPRKTRFSPPRSQDLSHSHYRGAHLVGKVEENELNNTGNLPPPKEILQTTNQSLQQLSRSQSMQSLLQSLKKEVHIKGEPDSPTHSMAQLAMESQEDHHMPGPSSLLPRPRPEFQTHEIGLPPLTEKERQLLRAHEGCTRCRRFYCGHRWFNCPNPPASSRDGIKPLTEEAALTVKHTVPRTPPRAPLRSPSPINVPRVTSTTTALPSPSSNNTTTVSHTQQTLALTRELWDVRRQITALKAQETDLIRDMKKLGVRDVPDAPVMPRADMATSEESQRDARELHGRVFADIISTLRDWHDPALRLRLQRESSARDSAEHERRQERQRRIHAEGILDDARRESDAPFIVPALMDAFVKLAELTGNVIGSEDRSYRRGY